MTENGGHEQSASLGSKSASQFRGGALKLNDKSRSWMSYCIDKFANQDVSSPEKMYYFSWQ